MLPDLPNLFVRGKAKNSIFGRGPLAFSLVALRIDFSIATRQGPGTFVKISVFLRFSACCCLIHSVTTGCCRILL